MKQKVLLNKLATVPKKTGCYLWLNDQGKIIYIGKAKNLFSRTHSYFNRSLNQKTQKMVSEICDLDYIIVDSENEALILESDLIKKHKPKYNILLKENAGYPYLLLTDQPKPQLIYTKKKINGVKGKYFGPFAWSQTKPYELYQLLNKLLPIQDCKHKWNLECFKCEILKKVHIPLLSENQQNFKAISKLIQKILNGEIDPLWQNLMQREQAAKKLMAYEEAAKLLKIQKALIALKNSYTLKIRNANCDIIGFKKNDDQIAIIIFSLVDGKLIAKQELVDEYLGDWQEVLACFLFQYYADHSIPKKIYLGFQSPKIALVAANLHLNLIVPQKGEMMHWLALAVQNAQAALNKISLKQLQKQQNHQSANQALKQLLQLNRLTRIEAFDVSQFFGSNRVGAMVVYTNGLPDPKAYRKFLIKNEALVSDLDCFQEILYRRYTKLNDNLDNKPDLIILDGGITHYNLAQECLDNLQLDIPFVALVKNNKHQTDHLIYRKQVIEIKEQKNIYYYLAKIQTDVHNYAITFFRKKNLQSHFVSALKNIPGLGPIRMKKILEKYENIINIEKASIEELSQIVTHKTALNLKKRLAEIKAANNKLNQKLLEEE